MNTKIKNTNPEQWEAYATDERDTVVGIATYVDTKPTGMSFVSRFLKIIHVTSGAADWNIGGETHHANKDSVLLFNNVSSRSIVEIYGSDPLTYDSYDFLPNIFDNDSELLQLFYSGVVVHLENTDGQLSHIIALLKSIRKAVVKKSERQTRIAVSLIHAVLMSIADMIDTNAEKFKSDRRHVSQTMIDIANYIQENFTQELSLSELAERAHFSNGYFSTMFKSYTGSSISRYISKCRIEHACKLIAEEKMNVFDAAIESGFKTSSGFYRAFTQIKNMTPTEYIKRYH